MAFTPTALSADEDRLRVSVRRYLSKRLGPNHRPGMGLAGLHDPEFSRDLARQGWVGMSIPVAFGGAGATAVQRHIVVEELLAVGAPVGAHWVAERQTAPTLLSFGTQEQKEYFLPRIAAGECWFALGMSEPDAGSDLASVRTSATKVDGGWLVNGTKVWTTNAHLNHFAVVLCRTSASDDRHGGLSQLIVDLHAPGVVISPIVYIDGRHDFNEVVMTDVFVSDERVLGAIGDGWHQVTSELAYERSGPDRYLSTLPLFRACLEQQGPTFGAAELASAGMIAAKLWAIRQLGLATARALERGEAPAIEAALVKDVGTLFEQESVESLRQIADRQVDPASGNMFENLLGEAIATAPGFTLRGGTTEVLRSVAAKGLR